MSGQKEFKCQQCEGRTQIAEGEVPPQCCGESMIEAEPLDKCTLSGTAEHSRFDEMNEPCDDGRAG